MICSTCRTSGTTSFSSTAGANRDSATLPGFARAHGRCFGAVNVDATTSIMARTHALGGQLQLV